MDSTRRIGIIGPEMMHGAFHTIVRGAVSATVDGNPRILVYSSGRSLQGVVLRSNTFNEMEVVTRFADPEVVDAIAVYVPGLMPQMSESAISRFVLGLPVPVVAVGIEINGVASVSFDFAGAMDRIVEHIVKVHGSRRIVYIGESAGNPYGPEKFAGFQSAALKAGVEAMEDRITIDYANPESAEYALDLVMDRDGGRADAILCESDGLAFQVIGELHKRGIHVPGDMIVVGFGDLPVSRLSTPSITTIRQDLHALGKKAVQLCLDSLDGGGESLILDLPPIFRRSCGCDPWLAPRETNPALLKQPEYRSALDAINAAVDTGDTGRLRRTLTALAAEVDDGANNLFRQALDLSQAGPVCESATQDTELIRTIVEMAANRTDVQTERNLRLVTNDLTRDAIGLVRKLDRVVDIQQFRRTAHLIFGNLGIVDHRVLRIAGPKTAAVVSSSEGLPHRSVISGLDNLAEIVQEMRDLTHSGAVTTVIPLPFNADILGYAVVNLFSEHAHTVDSLASSLGSLLNRLRLLEVLDESEAARREAFRRQVEAQDQLVQNERLASLGRLVANVAHQMNTPIGVATTALSHLRLSLEDILKTKEESACEQENLEEFLTALSLIESSVRRSADIVARFGSIVPISEEPGQSEIEFGRTVEVVLASLRSELRSSEIQVVVDIPRPIFLSVPANSLERILFALVSNSIDHAFENCRDRRISIRVTGDDHGALIEYSDNGNGVDAAILPEIFEPFSTTKRVNGKLGLGLHAVHNLVTGTLRGTVKAESRPGQGLAVEIILPSEAVCLYPPSNPPAAD